MSGRFRDFTFGSEIPEGPCRGCGDRAAGCHAECRRYQLYRQICRARRAKLHAESRLDEAEHKRGKRTRYTAGERFKRR